MKRFLIVEDSMPIRLILRRSLAHAAGKGVEFEEATNRQDALAKFVAFQPDVVFLDMHLDQDEPGLTVLKEILTLDPAARVIIVTGLRKDDPEVRASLDAGAIAHLGKPIRLGAIQRVLAEIGQ